MMASCQFISANSHTIILPTLRHHCTRTAPLPPLPITPPPRLPRNPTTIPSSLLCTHKAPRPREGGEKARKRKTNRKTTHNSTQERGRKKKRRNKKRFRRVILYFFLHCSPTAPLLHPHCVVTTSPLQPPVTLSLHPHFASKSLPNDFLHFALSSLRVVAKQVSRWDWYRLFVTARVNSLTGCQWNIFVLIVIDWLYEVYVFIWHRISSII